MSRYRPPRTAGTPLITPEGAARLRAELHELWHVRRPQVTQAVSEAAALGDRSENAEYIYGKKMLREIDSRVRFLRKRLENLKVVGERPADPNRVYFGAWVTLEDEDGEQARYRIVGPDELDLRNNQISIDSPLARALVGKELDAEVLVRTPAGKSSGSSSRSNIRRRPEGPRAQRRIRRVIRPWRATRISCRTTRSRSSAPGAWTTAKSNASLGKRARSLPSWANWIRKVREPFQRFGQPSR